MMKVLYNNIDDNDCYAIDTIETFLETPLLVLEVGSSFGNKYLKVH